MQERLCRKHAEKTHNAFNLWKNSDFTVLSFSGEIPYEIGNLRSLEFLGLGLGNLSGTVPATVFNMSTLIELELVDNRLSGNLPSTIDQGLPNLEELYLGVNNLSGKIPSSITNMSKLSVLDLGTNSFSGFMPPIGELRNLELLSLCDNYLTSPTRVLSSVASLTNCKDLLIADLGTNPLDGVIPSSFLGNLSVSLQIFPWLVAMLVAAFQKALAS